MPATIAIGKGWGRRFEDLLRRAVGTGARRISDGLAAAMAYDCSAVEYLRYKEAAKDSCRMIGSLESRSSHPVVRWYVPAMDNAYGGGIYTVYRFARTFETLGASCRLCVVGEPGVTRRAVAEAFPEWRVEVESASGGVDGSCDLAIATSWQTVYHMLSREAGRSVMVYFIQDAEDEFYPRGTRAVLAEATYRVGLPVVCGGEWLQQRYMAKYGSPAFAYRFAIDSSLFHAPPSDAPRFREGHPRVFFYGRPQTERRCFDLGVAALNLAVREIRDVEIVTAGADLRQRDFPVKVTSLGNLTLPQTAALYRTCDVGLVLSATNLSYLPLELTASGCAVVSNGGGNVEWFFPSGRGLVLAEPFASTIAEAIINAVTDTDLRRSTVEAGMQQISASTWEQEIRKVYRHVMG